MTSTGQNGPSVGMKPRGRNALNKSPKDAAVVGLLDRTREIATWLGEGDPGAEGSVLLSRSVAAEVSADLTGCLNLIRSLTAELDDAREGRKMISSGAMDLSVMYASANERAERAEAERDALREALERQIDNMSFALNRVSLGAWHERFERELEQDRSALAMKESG